MLRDFYLKWNFDSGRLRIVLSPIDIRIAPCDGAGVRGYRCSASTVEGFVQQLACCYLRHGYWWYVLGKVPEWKDPEAVDEKLIAKYGIAVSESTRRRRKKLGLANLQYLRYRRMFVILATAGTHAFRQIEAGAVRDIRRVPIKIWGYSISYRPGGRTRKGEPDPRWHSHVEIERPRYKEIRDLLLDLAVHRSAEALALEFYHLPFEPYAPIRRQMLNLWRAVNRRRKAAGYSLLPISVLPLRRRIVQPFGPVYREITVEGVDEGGAPTAEPVLEQAGVELGGGESPDPEFST